MEYDQRIVNYESGTNNVLVVDSPNFPLAGKGLISNRKQPITKDTGLPYWGKLYLHMKNYCNIEEVKMSKSEYDRLVILPVQPFLHLGLEVYVLGSLSCVAAYSNDATFNGWNEKPLQQDILNNCTLTYSEALHSETVEGFMSCVKTSPVWIESVSTIKFGEEFLTAYRS